MREHLWDVNILVQEFAMSKRDPYAMPAEEVTEQPAKSARVAELPSTWGWCKHCSAGGCEIHKRRALCFPPFWARKGRKKKCSKKACGAVPHCIGSALLSLITWTWIICASPEKCWPTLHSTALQLKYTANTPTKKNVFKREFQKKFVVRAIHMVVN